MQWTPLCSQTLLLQRVLYIPWQRHCKHTSYLVPHLPSVNWLLHTQCLLCRQNWNYPSSHPLIHIYRAEMTARGKSAVTSTPLVGGKQNSTVAMPSRPGSLSLLQPTMVIPPISAGVQLANRPGGSECTCVVACQSTSEHSQVHHLMYCVTLMFVLTNRNRWISTFSVYHLLSMSGVCVCHSHRWCVRQLAIPAHIDN